MSPVSLLWDEGGGGGQVKQGGNYKVGESVKITAAATAGSVEYRPGEKQSVRTPRMEEGTSQDVESSSQHHTSAFSQPRPRFVEKARQGEK